MPQNILTEADIFRIIHSVAEAALYNQKSITKSSQVLDRSIEELRKARQNLVPAISTSVREQLKTDLKALVDDAAVRISQEWLKQLSQANHQAQTAARAYKKAAEETTTYCAMIAAGVSLFCSVITCLLVVWLVRR